MEKIRQSGTGYGAKNLFIFTLIGLFVLMSALVLAAGARVFRFVQNSAEENYVARTAVSYLAGKVRAEKTAGGISLSTVEGETVLTLASKMEGEEYHTYLYNSEEGIAEYYGLADRAFDPGLGQTVIQNAAFDATLTGGLLHLSVSSGEATGGISLYLETEGGMNP